RSGGAGGADFLSVFDKPQRDALVLLFLRLHHAQIVAAEILWGLWLFPMGALAYKSRFLPRFIGVWLIINGVAYIVLSLTGLFFPDYQDKVFVYSQPCSGSWRSCCGSYSRAPVQAYNPAWIRRCRPQREPTAGKTPTRLRRPSPAHTGGRLPCTSPERSRPNRYGRARAARATSSPVGQKQPDSRPRRRRTANRPPS